MPTIPTYTGQWIDWSHGRVLGSYRTFSVQHTLIIVGATGAYLTVVGGSVWSMWAFFAHRYFSLHPDVVDLQHRAIYRNKSTPVSAVIDAFWIYWSWKPWTLCGRGPNPARKSWIKRVLPWHARPQRATHLGRRTCLLIAPALFIFAIFAAAGILGSYITSPAYRSNIVLVNYEAGKCGITLFDNTIDANNNFDIDTSNRTRAAVAYARTCYSTASGVVDSITCSLFVKRRLEYNTAAVGCPFGDPEKPFNQTICAFNTNMAAFALQTDRLNSHEHFGINAPKKDRIEMYKEMVCSPLIQNGFTRAGSSHGAEASGNTTVTEFLYGSAQGIGDYTYSYNAAAAYDNVPFGVTTLMHNSTGAAPWIPASNLSRANADVAIVFIAPNSIKYRNQTKDPVFQATYNETVYSNIGVPFHVYDPDYKVVVLACTEQYSICNPQQNDLCTPLDGQTALLENVDHIDLNPSQYVTAIRMIYMIADGNTFSSIDGIGPDALQIWSKVHDFVTSAVPDNQWQLEVRGWLDTTLAKWQAYMVNYAYNTAQLGSHGHIDFPMSNDTLDKYWRSQCQNQKISNVGQFQNVNVFGFSMIWAGGGVLIILALFLKLIVKTCRKCRGRMQNEHSKARRIAWNIDGYLQQQRLALQTSGYYDLIGGEGDVPYLGQVADLPLPFNAIEVPHSETDEMDTMWSPRAKPMKEVQPASQITVNTDSLDGPAPDSPITLTRLPDRDDTRNETDVSQAQNPPAETGLAIQSTGASRDLRGQDSRFSSRSSRNNIVESIPLLETFHTQVTHVPRQETNGTVGQRHRANDVVA